MRGGRGGGSKGRRRSHRRSGLGGKRECEEGGRGGEGRGGEGRGEGRGGARRDVDHIDVLWWGG